MTMQEHQGDRPIFSWIDGVVYKTGFRRDIAWNGDAASTDLGTFLHSLGRVIERQTGASTFDIDAPADPTQPGTITLTIRHAPQPYGKRTRGARGGHKPQAAHNPELTSA